ncbi:DUF2845 domain-containing protein [Kaarinaea lacus]
MRFSGYFLILLLLVFAHSTSYADTTMRCGSKIISVGDSKAEVLIKCGEPLLKEAIGQKEKSKRIDIPLTSDTGTEKNKQNTATVRRKESVTRTIDQWTYNQGSGKLLKILIFEGGELVEINNGDRT